MASNYMTIRDDSALKSLSSNERDFLRSCALRGGDAAADCTPNELLRADGRRGHDVRKVRLHLARWDNGAEATVQWGKSRVTSLCTAELVPPSPDKPNEGMVSFTVDLSPMAAPSFRLAPAVSTGGGSGGSTSRGSNYSDQDQRLLSNRILRCIERIILIGGALDTEALVLEGGQWVWKFTIALTVLDAGGNLLDACVLATVAALRHYRKPQVELSSTGGGSDSTDAVLSPSDNNNSPPISLPTMIPSTVKEATPLPLHHSPLSISFGLIPADDAAVTSSTSTVAALIDPTDREELVQSGSLTIAMNIHSEVCLLDYGGGCELTPAKMKECCKVAEAAVKELCQLLEDTLRVADEQAQAERLRLLQLQTHNSTIDLPPLPPPLATTPNNIPFLRQSDDDNNVMDASVDDGKVQQVQTQAEEAYRKQALDYASGHVATAVREDNDRDRRSSSNQQQAGSLLAAMLKSVGETPVVGDTSNALDAQAAAPSSPLIQEEVAKEPSPKKSKAAAVKEPVPMDLDDDEEEEAPVVLQSEFEAVQTPTGPLAAARNEEDADIEDLSMAIKSKKSKKKKSKKK